MRPEVKRDLLLIVVKYTGVVFNTLVGLSTSHCGHYISERGLEPIQRIEIGNQNKKASKSEDLLICYSKNGAG